MNKKFIKSLAEGKLLCAWISGESLTKRWHGKQIKSNIDAIYICYISQ